MKVCVGVHTLKATTSVKKIDVKSLLHLSSFFLSLSLSIKIDLTLLMRECCVRPEASFRISGQNGPWHVVLAQVFLVMPTLPGGMQVFSIDLHMAHQRVKEREPFMS